VQLRRLSAGFAEDREAIGASLDGISDLSSATAQLLVDVRQPLTDDIRELGELASLLNDHEATVEGVLQRLPTKLDRIIGTATYGSWFNFYLCGSKGQIGFGKDEQGNLQPLPGSGQLEQFELINPAPRCRFGVGTAPDGSDRQ
jgi:phospholipid/cholesterol/gamma-HCH transport system substrate-binding protein